MCVTVHFYSFHQFYTKMHIFHSGTIAPWRDKTENFQNRIIRISFCFAAEPLKNNAAAFMHVDIVSGFSLRDYDKTVYTRKKPTEKDSTHK